MPKTVQKGKKLWQGAVYLSIAAIVIKILSAIYRIPYQNIAGDVGFYVYQQIYPIYGVAIILSTYGFPVIISKLICEHNNELSKIIRSAFISLLIISFFVFISFYYSAPYIAKVMGDPLLETPLRAVSFTFLLIPLLSILRGYFQGKEEMLPTAVSQVTEQLIRVSAILILTYYFMASGSGPYAAGTGAAIGSVIGGFIGFLVLLLFFRRENNFRDVLKKEKLCLKTVRTILGQGLMVCFSSLLLVFFQFIDSITILRVMIETGVTLDLAKVSKGVFDRGQPLIQMGTVITTSFSLVVVPLITKVSLEGKKEILQKYCSFALRISILIGAAASVGLASIIEPTNVMLFRNNLDSHVLLVLVFAIFFTSVFLTTSAILHGLNNISLTVKHVVIAVLIKFICNIFFVVMWGTLGAAVSTVLACAVAAILNVIALRRLEALPSFSFTKGIKVIIALTLMGLVIAFWKEINVPFLESLYKKRTVSTIVALTSVVLGFFVFLLSITKGRFFSEEELEMFPKIRKLTALFGKRK